jgi:hypothetical protein
MYVHVYACMCVHVNGCHPDEHISSTFSLSLSLSLSLSYTHIRLRHSRERGIQAVPLLLTGGRQYDAQTRRHGAGAGHQPPPGGECVYVCVLCVCEREMEVYAVHVVCAACGSSVLAASMSPLLHAYVCLSFFFSPDHTLGNDGW